MDRKRINELLPLMTAFANGEDIEYRRKCNDALWHDTIYPCFEDEELEFRLKPKSLYRAFVDVRECMEELKKHSLPNFLYDNKSNIIFTIGSIGKEKVHLPSVAQFFTFQEMVEYFSFYDDRTPFGIKILDYENEQGQEDTASCTEEKVVAAYQEWRKN